MKAQLLSIVENDYGLNIAVLFPDTARTLTLQCSKRSTFLKLNGNIPDEQVKKSYWDISYVTVTRKSNRTGNNYTQNILLDMDLMK